MGLGWPASRLTTKSLRIISSKRLESLVPRDRRANYENTLYPNRDVLCLAGVQFSGYHEDADLNSDEMQRLSPYDLTTGDALLKVPKLKALMKTCENNLRCPAPPAGWDTVAEVFDESI